MKEQIEKILMERIEASEDAIYGIPSSAQEITDRAFKFIKWKEEKTEKVDDKYFVVKEILEWRTIFEDVEFNTIEELYNFWYSNVFLKTKKG
jgi:hypothetical protein